MAGVTLIRRVLRSLAFRGRRLGAAVVAGPLVRLLRLGARLRQLVPGVTVIAVNFNTADYLATMVRAVRQYSPPDTRILVVDNASSDASRAWLRSRPDVKLIRLPVNVNHGPAMDIGILRCRTSYFVALDIDAFPIAADWLDRLINPLKAGTRVSGASVPFEGVQPYIHACCLAMETERFVARAHTFRIGPSWDTAQRISQLEYPSIYPLPLTSCRGPSLVGSVFGDVVYHNFYSARFAATGRTSIDEGNADEELVVTVGDASSAWNEALVKYFPGQM